LRLRARVEYAPCIDRLCEAIHPCAKLALTLVQTFGQAVAQRGKMGKLDTIQMGRGLAAVSIVIFHLTTLSRDYQNGCFYSPWEHVLRAGVDVFFVISGIVMVSTTYRRYDDPGTSKRFIIHRISRIYPPYLFLTVILTFFWMRNPGAVNAKHGGVDLFSSFTLWPSKKLPLVPVAWSLSYEMMFYVVFFFLLLLVKKRYFTRALFVWAAFVLAGCALRAFDLSGSFNHIWWIIYFCCSPHVLEFVVGCFIGLAVQKVVLPAGRICTAIGIALFAAATVALQMTSVIANIKADWVQVLLFGPASAFLVYGVVAWERGPAPLRPPWIAIWSGDISYSIYLVHILVIHAAYRYAWHMLTPHGLGFVFLLNVFVVSIVASVVFYYLLEKPLSKWTRIGLEKTFRVPPKLAASVVIP
jgi:exopolysaccharide production protein ExoZ